MYNIQIDSQEKIKRVDTLKDIFNSKKDEESENQKTNVGNQPSKFNIKTDFIEIQQYNGKIYLMYHKTNAHNKNYGNLTKRMYSLAILQFS